MYLPKITQGNLLINDIKLRTCNIFIIDFQTIDWHVANIFIIINNYCIISYNIILKTKQN